LKNFAGFLPGFWISLPGFGVLEMAPLRAEKNLTEMAAKGKI
jgi:hypothetical protein